MTEGKPSVDLEGLERLATICATVDPIGPGWYSEAELARFMEPCDARLTAAAHPGTVLDLIEAARNAAGGYEPKANAPNPSPSPEPVKDQAEQGVASPSTSADRGGWQPIETAPVRGLFLAIDAKLELRKCWRHRPSSRTDEILTWARNSRFKATHWQPLPEPPALLNQTEER